jgi:hypothetical protein
VFKGTVAAETVTCDEDADSSEMELGLDDLSIGDDEDLALSRTQDSPTLTSSTDPEHSSDVYGQFDGSGATGSSQVASPSQPLSSGDQMPMISQAPTFHHPRTSSNQSHPNDPIHSPSQQLTNPVGLTDSRRRLTPTPSISIPPPPVVDSEDDEIVVQPAMKGKRKARPKTAKPQQGDPSGSESGPNRHDAAAALPKRRSARSGQKSKSRAP